MNGFELWLPGWKKDVFIVTHRVQKTDCLASKIIKTLQANGFGLINDEKTRENVLHWLSSKAELSFTAYGVTIKGKGFVQTLPSVNDVIIVSLKE